VVFSPDSKLVAAVADDGGAGIWRSASGTLLTALPGFGSLGGGNAGSTPFSPGAAFTADASLVALANADGNVRIWDVPARKQLGAVAAGWVNALAFAPHGRMLAAMTWDGDLVVARSPPGIPLRTHFQPNSCDPDFEPVIADNGTHVLARAAGGAGVWTVEGDRVATLAPPARPAFLRSSVGSAAFSGDGETIAAATAGNSCARSAGERHATGVWRLERRSRVRTLGAGAPVTLDARGTLVAVGGDVWPSDRSGPLPGLGQVLALSPGGGRTLSLRGGALVVVDTHSGGTVATLRGSGPLVSEARDFGSLDASFSPDGKRLLTPWNANARLWDATSGEPIAFVGEKGAQVDRAAFGDGGRLVLATSPRRAWVLSAADGEPVSSVSGPFAGGGVFSDGTLAAAPQNDGALDVVDLATGTRTALQPDTGVVLTSLSFGPTADVILARDANGDVHVVSCEICAPEDELLELARSRLATLSRIEPKRPPFVGVA
jgi:WD40 repeat protein